MQKGFQETDFPRDFCTTTLRLKLKLSSWLESIFSQTAAKESAGDFNQFDGKDLIDECQNEADANGPAKMTRDVQPVTIMGKPSVTRHTN
jgi:hypothetical protein